MITLVTSLNCNKVKFTIGNVIEITIANKSCFCNNLNINVRETRCLIEYIKFILLVSDVSTRLYMLRNITKSEINKIIDVLGLLDGSYNTSRSIVSTALREYNRLINYNNFIELVNTYNRFIIDVRILH